MKTYQDLLECGEDLKEKCAFMLSAIKEHQASEEYQVAQDAELYMKTLNPTIMKYQKVLYRLTGEAVPDMISANHKCASSFFKRFVTQENQYLLGNGATFGEDSTKGKLGGDKFDIRLQTLGRYALIGGLAFGFVNLDHMEVFKLTEFKPLWDEEDGALKAGIRFWQIADNKPLRATLYELDGYTEFIRRKGKDMEVYREKQPYVVKVQKSEADGIEILEGKAYPTFPIIPLWGNPEHQSELITIRSQIDCYDLIKSGFANDLDDAQQIYWILTNTGGMDDLDLAQFVERIKTTKAAVVGTNNNGNASAEAHTIEVPYQSREVYLTRLETDMYKDAMALDTTQIAAGQVTATQIEAAYEPLNEKADMFEYCVQEFMDGVLAVLGIEDTVTFVRSKMSNVSEEIDAIIKCADYTSEEYTTEKLLTILGDIDRVDEVLEQRADESMSRFNAEDEFATDEDFEDEEDSGDDVIGSINKMIEEL